MAKFYLTTPLYYVNSRAHLGHAYTNIIADCLARFKRIKGDEVFFLTGTDEHGEKVKTSAISAGKTPESFADEIVEHFKFLWEKLNIDYDFFIRTTSPLHIKVVKAVVEKLLKKGDIYKDKYKGFYCLPCESFLAPGQVKEGLICPLCKRKVEEIEEENYFFRLSKYQGWLQQYLKMHPNFIKPQIRYNEVCSFLDNNKLLDLCISRPKMRVSWGINFPGDDDYVVYVWFDALLNYITAAGYFSDQERFSQLWPADIHFIGKDILKQHAIYWPIILKSLDLEMPAVIFAHGWWKVDEEKMSKSKGNVVDPFFLIEKISCDGLRYFLLREIAVGSDGNFSYQAIINRLNSELANDIGNLINRTLVMAEKYFQGKVSALSLSLPDYLKESYQELFNNYSSYMEEIEFSSALGKIINFVNALNKSIEEVKPWILWKEKKIEELKNFIYSLLEGIRIIAIYLYPFIPKTTNLIYEYLGIDKGAFSLSEAGWGEKKGFLVKVGKPLFPRRDVLVFEK